MNTLHAWIEESFEETIVLDGWDKHIVGRISRYGQPDILLYDREGMLNDLVERDGMTYEEAVEYFEFNIAGGWFGDYTPAFLVERNPDHKEAA